jgi:hypothetical protein
MGDAGGSYLARAAGGPLRTLSLSGCGLGFETARALAESLRVPSCNMQRLVLDSNEMDTRAIDVLLRAAARRDPVTLRHLNVRYNRDASRDHDPGDIAAIHELLIDPQTEENV